MKNKKSLLFKICLALFIIGIAVFITISILNLYVDDPISRVVFSIISTVAQILISTGGISFLVEITSLNNIVNKTINTYSNKMLNKTMQIEYMKENFNEDARRDLLFLSYLNKEDYEILKCNENRKDIMSNSYEKILQQLIRAVYAKSDRMRVVYRVENNQIIKDVERELTLVNIFGVKNDFKISYYFNDINGEPDLVELKEFKVDNECLDLNKYIQKGVNDVGQSSYKYYWRFNYEDIPGKDVKIKYKLSSKLPIDDKSHGFVSSYMVKNLTHTIILNKATGAENVDIALFSLVQAMTKEKEVFKYNVSECNKDTIMCEINGEEWLFPSDGYVLYFR